MILYLDNQSNKKQKANENYAREVIVGTLRAFDVKPNNVKPLVYATKQLKQDLFDPPNVKGWVGGVDWLDSSSVLLRN